MNQIDQHFAALREAIYVEAREQVRNEVVASLLGAAVAPVAKAVQTKTPAVKPSGLVRRAGPGPKRSPEEIESTAHAVRVFLKEYPGSGAEAIKSALKVDLSEIELPIKKMLASKQIKKRGQKRATKYYPVG